MNHLVGQVLDQKVRLLSLVGEGGMGAVFRGRQLNLDRDVAVKLLKPQFSSDEDLVRRFSREARAAGQLRSRHVIKVFDHGRSSEGAYIIMEYSGGVPLSDVLQLEGRLTPERAVTIAAQVLSGLAEAHGKGIIHRDLKTDNVMIERDYADHDFALILDFGIAKLEGSTSIFTAVGSVFGTPVYMAPEQCKGEVADPRTDLYAVGVMLYEMLAGTPPFSPELRPTELMLAHIEQAPPPITLYAPELPPRLSELVMRLLSKARSERPSTAERVLRELLSDVDFDAPTLAPAAVGSPHELTIPDLPSPLPRRYTVPEEDIQESDVPSLAGDTKGAVTLSPEEFRVLSRMGDGASVRGIAEKEQLSLPWLLGVLSPLVEKGVVRIERGQRPPPAVQSERIAIVQRVLTEVLGPIAPIVVQKTIAQLARPGAAFGEDQLDQLLERLALRIQDASKRRGFLGQVREALAQRGPQ